MRCLFLALLLFPAHAWGQSSIYHDWRTMWERFAEADKESVTVYVDAPTDAAVWEAASWVVREHEDSGYHDATEWSELSSASQDSAHATATTVTINGTRWTFDFTGSSDGNAALIDVTNKTIYDGTAGGGGTATKAHYKSYVDADTLIFPMELNRYMSGDNSWASPSTFTRLMEMSASTDDGIAGHFWRPNGFGSRDTVEVKFAWTHYSTSGNVRFASQASYRKVDSAEKAILEYNTSTVNDSLTASASPASVNYALKEDSIILPLAPESSDVLLHVVLERLGADAADTNASGVYIFGVEVWVY